MAFPRKPVVLLALATLVLAFSSPPAGAAEEANPARLFPSDTLVLVHVDMARADLDANYAAACPRAVSPTPAAAFASLAVGILGPLGPVEVVPFNRARFTRQLGGDMSRRERIERLLAARKKHRIAMRRKLCAAAARDRSALAQRLKSFLEGGQVWLGLMQVLPGRLRWALALKVRQGPKRFKALLAACGIVTHPVPSLPALSLQGAPSWSLPTFHGEPTRGDPAEISGRDLFAFFPDGLVVLTGDRTTLRDLVGRATRPGDPGILAIDDVRSLETRTPLPCAYLFANLPKLLTDLDRGLSWDQGFHFVRLDSIFELFRAKTLTLQVQGGGADRMELAAPDSLFLSLGRASPTSLRTAAALPPSAAVAASIPVEDLSAAWKRCRDHISSQDRLIEGDRAGLTAAAGRSPFARHLSALEGDLGLGLEELASLCEPEVGFFLVPLADASPWNFAFVLQLRERASVDRLARAMGRTGRGRGGFTFRESRCAGHRIAMVALDTQRRGLDHDCRTALSDDDPGLFLLNLDGTVVLSPRFGPVRLAAETWNRRAGSASRALRFACHVCPGSLWRYLFRDRLLDPTSATRPYAWRGAPHARGLVLDARNAVLPMALSLVAGLDGHLRYRELARLDEDRFELLRTAFEAFVQKTGRLPASLTELLEVLDLPGTPSWLFHPADGAGSTDHGGSRDRALDKSTLVYRVPSFEKLPWISRPCLADRRAFLRKHHVFLFVAKNRGRYSFYVNALTTGSLRKTVGGR